MVRGSKTVGAVALIFLLAVVACGTEVPQQSKQTQVAPVAPAADIQVDTTPVPVFDGSSPSSPLTESSVKTFIVSGENFKFIGNGEDNPDIRVNIGDTVRIEFTSTSGFHDWVVDEFNAATERVSTGDRTAVEFVADKAGMFEYYCSVGSHRAQGMKGKLIVEN
jgi:plastocyanin